MESRVLKIISVIILIVGIIGSIVYGVIYQNELDDLIDSIPKDTIVSGFTIAAIGIVTTFLLFIVLLTLATILNHLEVMRYSLENLERKDKRLHSSNQNGVKTTSPLVNTATNAPITKINKSTGKWVCKECGEQNPSNAMICRGCGSYR